MDEGAGTILPHSDFGDPECCGCLIAATVGDSAEIICNECGVVVRTVPTTDLRKTLTEMELSLDVASGICPHCLSVNLFPGFTRIESFVCKQCGLGVAQAQSAGKFI